jgi:hypothetical protein
MRTQNPPPLKACRFDSDLGHQSNQRLTRAGPVTGTTSQTHRTSIAQHTYFASAHTYTFLTQKTPTLRIALKGRSWKGPGGATENSPSEIIRE